MASVTLGSSSPTYKLAEGDAPAAALEPVPVCGVPASSPEGDGDSLGEGIELLSSPPLEDSAAGTASTAAAVVVGAGLSSLAGLATGDAVSTALLVADIMNDALTKGFSGFLVDLVDIEDFLIDFLIFFGGLFF